MKLKAAISLLFAALITASLPCYAQNVSPLQFREKEWSFGTIREEGGPVSHVFTFVNKGRNPVAIDRVSASCGCTTPEYTRGLLKPGESAEIKVTFEPMGYPGSFVKSVVVVSEGGKYHDLLIIKGDVTPRIKPVEEEYPFDMGGGLRFDNLTLAFRQVAQGKSSSMTVRYANTSPKAVTLEITPSEPSELLAVHAPETICAGCRGDITLTYDLAGKPESYGVINNALSVKVSGTSSPRTIYATMIGVDNFSGKSIETAPRPELDAQYHGFGNVRSRKIPYTHRLTIFNEGGETLYIRSITEKSGFKSTLHGGMSVAPGASLPFEIILYSDKYERGDVIESLIMVVNDPLRPVREIRMSARIE